MKSVSLSKILSKLLLITLTINFFAVEAEAQFSRMKNKVQYQEFNWKYIESKHFDVYYDDGSEYLAKYTALRAEESLKDIQDLLNFKLSQRVTIVVYDTHNEFQQTNVVMMVMPEGVGGVTEMFKNRVVLPFQGDYSQMDHVIHHELVHAVINVMFYGGTVQSSISSGSTVQLPLWMNEGLCEFSSLEGMDTKTDMFMRDLVISEELPPLQRMGGFLAYRGGQTFYWYIANKYGEERVGDLLNRLKINRTLEGAFLSTFNMDLKDFNEQWQKDLKKYYWPDLDVFQDPDDFAVAVTDHKDQGNFYNTSPAVSPDGEKIAFMADEKGVFKVFIQKVGDEDSRRQLVSSNRAQDFEDLNFLTPGISWNPKGTKLAISAKAGPEDAIFIVDAKTGDYEKLTFGIKSITSVVWSPDGNSLAFISSDEVKSDIRTYDLKTKELKRVTDDYYSEMHPIWSPQSKKIYFISDRLGDTDNDGKNDKTEIWNHDVTSTDIYSVDITTGEITRLTNDPEYRKISLAVSSDDNKLLYVSDKNGIGNVYSLDLVTGNVKPKTNSLNGITQISLSSDDSKLFFSVQKNAGYDIYFIRYPFEKDPDIEELPLTKYRKEWLEKREDVKQFIAEDFKTDKDQKLEGYGDFSVNFDYQEVVKPNKEVRKESEVVSMEASDEPGYEDTTFVEKDYKLKFTPDLILGNPGYSTFWGFQGVTQMLFSDILGNHQIYFQANLLLDLRNSSFLLSYNYLPEIIDYNITALHYAGFVYLRNQGENNGDYLYRFRNWGARMYASYPFDKYNRVEWGMQWLNSAKENVDRPSEPSESTMMLVPEARFVHDDVIWGSFSPQKGFRYYMQFNGTPKIGSQGISFMSLKTDARYYQPIIKDFLTIAMRGSAGASFGPNQQKFVLGGTENWLFANFKNDQLPFNDPEDFAFINDLLIMPLRGYPINAAQGSKFFMTNFELRYPLITALIAGPIPLLLHGMQGAFFYDMAGAWNDEFIATKINENGNPVSNNLFISSGIGFRTALFRFPVSLDIAWRYEFNNWSKPVYMFSIGYGW